MTSAEVSAASTETPAACMPWHRIGYHRSAIWSHVQKAAMRTIGNFLWFIFGGALMGLGWWLAGALCFLTIVGIPWGRACLVIGEFTFFPFGKEAISRKELSNQDDIGTGAMGLLGNILWFILAGVWLAVGHVLAAIACAITLIGIPFALQHLKLAGMAVAPIGKTIVTKEVAEAARRRIAEASLGQLRSRATP